MSSAGGTEPLWTPDGQALIFRQGQRQIMKVPITWSGDDLQVGVAREVFELDWAPADRYGPRLALVGADEKMLVIRRAEAKSSGAISLLLNWQQGLNTGR